MPLPILTSIHGVTPAIAYDLNECMQKPIYAVSDHTDKVVSVDGNPELEAQVLAHRDRLAEELSKGRTMVQPLLSVSCVTTDEMVLAEEGERQYRLMMWQNAMGPDPKKPHLTVVK